jgi:hypothetical protein
VWMVYTWLGGVVRWHCELLFSVLMVVLGVARANTSAPPARVSTYQNLSILPCCLAALCLYR